MYKKLQNVQKQCKQITEYQKEWNRKQIKFNVICGFHYFCL